MARTKNDILDEINTAANGYQDLAELQGNTSKVAFWKAIKDVVAFAVLTLETLFERHLNDVQKLIKTTEPGTPLWYKELAQNYQDGDTLVVQNNLTGYAVEDAQKRIITRVAVADRTGGGIVIKVAKGTDALTPLSTDEKTRFGVYINRVKFAGIPVEVVSLPADNLRLSATIELESLLFGADGKRLDGTDLLKTVISDHLKNYPFNAPFYLSRLVDAIQGVEGVKDVNITASKLNGTDFVRKIDEVPSGYLILDTENSIITYVLT